MHALMMRQERRRMMRRTVWLTAMLMAAATNANATDTRVLVNIENLAPAAGTFQTPFWVGFHEGEFDTYDGNTPASNDPRPGSIAMESLCEDGNTGPITADFAALSAGQDATLPGPNGPIAPGDTARGSFILDSTNPDNAWFSYASMIIPSNDFCIANGNPRAHAVFDEDGNFVAADFFVSGSETLDAGTEVNDELPANTAFFGQAAPNTGVDENGLIGTLGSDLPAIGFAAPGSGGILDAGRFRMADFLAPGYPLVKVSFAAAPAVVDDINAAGKLLGENEVPAVETSARGIAIAKLREEGTRLDVVATYRRLNNVTAAHLHLGQPGENGPVVALLVPADLDELSKKSRRLLKRLIKTSLTSDDLVGPLAGQPLDALAQAIADGNVYVNIHTEANPAGELRGNLALY